MKISHLFLTVILVSVFALSCKETTTQPVIPPAIKYTISQIKNVPYRLNRVSYGDSILNIQTLFPYGFAIDDTSIFGRDGCNRFSGSYVSDNDSITFLYIISTATACFPPSPFELCMLVGTWKLILADTTFVLKRHDTTIVFSSNCTMPIKGSAFTYTVWSLVSSNDTLFSLMESLHLLPTIEMSPQRQFELEWYPAPRNRYLLHNFMAGLFGIGENNTINYYSSRDEIVTPDNWTYDFNDRWFMMRILGSDHYSYTDSTFRLENRSEGFYYNFIKTAQKR